jgi:hypothetical protein
MQTAIKINNSTEDPMVIIHSSIASKHITLLKIRLKYTNKLKKKLHQDGFIKGMKKDWFYFQGPKICKQM